MKRIHHTATCTRCQEHLTWWNAQTCSQCGKKICRQHSLMLKRHNSSVLFAVCDGCCQHAASIPVSKTRTPVHA